MAKAKKMSTSFMYPVYSTLYYLTSYTFIWAHLSGSEVSFYLHVVTCFSERTPMFAEFLKESIYTGTFIHLSLNDR